MATEESDIDMATLTDQEDFIVDSDEGDHDSDDALNDEDGEEEEDVVKRKTPEPSPIWANNCGTSTADGLKCAFCPQIYANGNSSTSNLGNHLKRRHGSRPEVKKYIKDAAAKKERVSLKAKMKKKKEDAAKPPSVLSFIVRKPVIDTSKKIKIDESIVKWIATEHKPFNVVEKYSFRQMLFTAEPGYVCPSATKVTRDFDKFAEKTKETLKKEIIKDVTDAGHKTINVVSDHGTSKDRFRTQKNGVTVSRITNNFVMKTDTVAVLKCEGTQSGQTIRSDIKREVSSVGWDESWTVNWVTDNEAKQRSARGAGRHEAVGLATNYTGDCVDHTIELVSEESIAAVPAVEASVNKCRRFVDYQKDSSKARECFNNIMVEAGVQPLATIRGTSNRWFFKYLEVERVVLLFEHVLKFQEEFDLPPTFQELDEEDLSNLRIYIRCLKPIVEASKLFEGDQYPTGSSVIPFLDQIIHDLELLKGKLEVGPGKDFASKLLENLTSDRRFSTDGFKSRTPYNCLTLADSRYGDLYFNEDQKNKAIDDLELGLDAVYPTLREEVENQIVRPDVQEELAVVAGVSSFDKRRAELMAAKRSRTHTTNIDPNSAPKSFKEKIEQEISKMNSMEEEVPSDTNPCAWYRNHHKDFPLLAAYFKAHGAFPATSTSSERVFNMDGLVLTRSRTSLDPQRQASLIVTGDFLRKRQGDEYKLCKTCPMPPSKDARYVICCQKHNSK